MRLIRIFANEPLVAGATIALGSNAVRHVAQVLRMQVGDPLQLFDGSGGEHAAIIRAIGRGRVEVEVGAASRISRESPLAVMLLQGCARGEKMDFILQKATELGVFRVIPVLTARSGVQLDAAAARKRHAHWQGVIASACEQCGRNTLPQLDALSTLATALTLTTGVRLLLAPDDAAPTLPALITQHAAQIATGVSLLVGPEGGLSSAEIQQAQRAGYLPCRLGPRILRTETAGIAALTSLQVLAGDLR
jgi:16S rRNA (uracil1498-N3)-methyltransferase